MITLELTETQMQDLLQMIYLGEWMTQAYGNNEHAQEYEELIQKLYAIAHNNGIESDVEFDKKMGGYVPTNEFETYCDELIQQYDEHTFWEELIMRLATKELMEQGGEQLKPDVYEKQLNILIQKYEKECNEYGIEHLKFSRS